MARIKTQMMKWQMLNSKCKPNQTHFVGFLLLNMCLSVQYCVNLCLSFIYFFSLSIVLSVFFQFIYRIICLFSVYLSYYLSFFQFIYRIICLFSVYLSYYLSFFSLSFVVSVFFQFIFRIICLFLVYLSYYMSFRITASTYPLIFFKLR